MKPAGLSVELSGPSPGKIMIGVAADILKLSDQECRLIRDAGIRWFRIGGFGFDQELFLGGKRQPEQFLAFKDRLSELRRNGFQLMGITPGPADVPAMAGAPGSKPFLENYRRMCAYLGEEFRGLIDYWQVANELDIWIFRASLSLEQSVEFLKAGILGLKEAGNGLKVGINVTLFPSLPGEVDGNTGLHEGVFIAKGIYQDSGLELDYAGFDSYPGTWRRGGPESWDACLDAFHELTGKPIIIQEFGYASEGELMTKAEDESGIYPCAAKKWRFSWQGGHTRKNQAEFIGESFRVFARKPFVIGATYYRWNDSKTCWQCGQPDCPAETSWGLVDRNGIPKPSYEALKSSVRKYFPNPSLFES